MANETLSIVFEAVGTGTVIAATQGVIRTFTELPSRLADTVAKLGEARGGTEALGAVFSGFVSVAVPVATALTGLATAAATASVKLLDMGGKEAIISQAFERLNEKGIDTTALMERLKAATIGVVEGTDLQRLSIQALSGSLGITAGQLEVLTTAVFRSTRSIGDEFEPAMQRVQQALKTGRLGILATIPGFEGLRAEIEKQKIALEGQGQKLTDVQERQIALNAVLQIAAERNRALGEPVKTNAEALGVLVTQVKDAVGNFAALVATNEGVRAAIERLRPLFERLAGIIAQGAGVVGDLMARFFDLAPAVASLLGPSGGLLDALKSLFSTVAEVGGPVLRALIGIVKDVLPTLRAFQEFTVRVATALLGALLPVVGKLAEALRPLIARIAEFAREHLARALPVVEKVAVFLGVVLTNAVNHLAVALKVLLPILDFVLDVLGFIADKAAKLIGFFVDLASGIAEFAGGIFGGGGPTIQVQAPTVEVQAQVDVTADPAAIAEQTRRGVLTPLTGAIGDVADRLAVAQAANAAALEAELAGA